MRYRSALSTARGLGSAKGGTAHFWAQRLTAVALVPLSLWLVGAVVGLAEADYATVVAWARSPVVAALLLTTIVAGLYHAQLGLQVVLEDYVHTEWVKIAGVGALNLVVFLLGAISVVAVLRVTLSG